MSPGVWVPGEDDPFRPSVQACAGFGEFSALCLRSPPASSGSVPGHRECWPLLPPWEPLWPMSWAEPQSLQAQILHGSLLASAWWALMNSALLGPPITLISSGKLNMGKCEVHGPQPRASRVQSPGRSCDSWGVKFVLWLSLSGELAPRGPKGRGGGGRTGMGWGQKRLWGLFTGGKLYSMLLCLG